MIGVIGYLIGCFFVAVILTIIVAMFRPIKQHDDFRSWRVTLALLLLAVAGPYGYGEVMTRMHGAPMEPAVRQLVEDAEVRGELEYFKVLTFSDAGARVIAVANERSDWGGIERPVIAINMVKEDGEWVAKEYNFVNSFKRGKDSVSLPPYW